MNFFNKKEQQGESVYSVIDKELSRLYDMLYKFNGNNEHNVQVVWKRIEGFQDALLQALSKQPSHDEAIKDLQDTVTEMLLTGTQSEEIKVETR